MGHIGGKREYWAEMECVEGYGIRRYFNSLLVFIVLGVDVVSVQVYLLGFVRLHVGVCMVIHVW